MTPHPIRRDGKVLPRHDPELVRSGLWAHNGPATTVCGDARIFAPGGHHKPGEQSWNSIRLSVQEIGVLQTFPRAYPWRGRMGEQHLQVGNAVPPLLAAAIVAQFVGVAA